MRAEFVCFNWLISNCWLFCASRMEVRVVPYVVRVIAWSLKVSAFLALSCLNSLLSALMSFRASSILEREVD